MVAGGGQRRGSLTDREPHRQGRIEPPSKRRVGSHAYCRSSEFYTVGAWENANHLKTDQRSERCTAGFPWTFSSPDPSRGEWVGRNSRRKWGAEFLVGRMLLLVLEYVRTSIVGKVRGPASHPRHPEA